MDLQFKDEGSLTIQSFLLLKRGVMVIVVCIVLLCEWPSGA